MDLQITVLLALLALLALLSWYLAPGAWAKLLLAAGRRAAGLRSRHMTVDGLDWHYLEGGQGPHLVLVHGFGADADHWLRVAPRLRAHFRIIAPDLVGFGTSAAGEGQPFSIAHQAERLGRLLDALGVDDFIAGGNSMGGWIVATLAANRPRKARGLWLLAPLGVRDCKVGELLGAVNSGQDSPLEVTSLDEFEQRVFRPMFAQPPRLPYPLKKLYGQRAVERSAAARTMFGQVLRDAVPLEQTVAGLGLPVLLHWGDLDRAVDVSGAETLGKASRKVEIRLLENIGHLPMLEAGLRVGREFMNFLERNRLAGPAAADQRRGL